MEISGPLSIFHRTLVYARALQHLVLSLGRMVDFDLRIITEAGSGVKSYRVTPQDPVAWRATEESFDSKLERRLVEDFGKFAPDWDLIREPTSINVDGELFFPDFLLQSRIDRTKSWLMEVVGFWHPDYLRSKLRKLKGAGQPSAILLIDESLNVPMNELSQFQNVLRFKNRIKPVEVLRLIGEA